MSNTPRVFSVEINPDVDAPLYSSNFDIEINGDSSGTAHYYTLEVELKCNPFVPFKRIWVGWGGGGGGTWTFGETPPPPFTARNVPGILTGWNKNRQIFAIPFLTREYLTSQGNSTGAALGHENFNGVGTHALDAFYVVPPWLNNQNLSFNGAFNIPLFGAFDKITTRIFASSQFSFVPAIVWSSIGMLEQQAPFSLT